MKPVNTLFTEWTSIDTVPFEAKNRKKFLEMGNAAIIANTGLTTSICGITEDAINTGKILFINPKIWNPKLITDDFHLDSLKAIGYLVQNEPEDASIMLNSTCIDTSITLIDAIWEKQCRFNENFSGYRTMDRNAKIALQDAFPDISFIDKLLKYMAGNERELKADIKSFKEKTEMNLSAYRERILSSHLKELSNKEYLAQFSHDEKELSTLYKMLKEHIKEMKIIPTLFGCTNYLLKGGKYHDVDGFCKLVPIEEIEAKNWSLKPEDYI